MMVQSFPRSFSLTDPVDRELDACGLRCPMPLLKAKQVIQSLQPGQTLRVRATDAGSWRDFQAWSAQAGHPLLLCTEQDGIFIYVLCKSDRSIRQVSQ